MPPTAPQMVVKYAIPAAFSLLNDNKGETKAASMQLLTTLARLMGPTLLDHTSALNPLARQKVMDAPELAR